ncbi:MAG: hypothetical protein ACHQJ4_01630 [Ignavibacteria bacterium]
MNRAVKYLLIAFKKIDVSPFGGRNIVNLTLYLFAGVCILIFTGKSSASQNYFYKDQVGQTICRSVEKFTFNEFTLEKFELINPGGFIIFSSYSKIVLKPNEPKIPKVRGPPPNRF